MGSQPSPGVAVFDAVDEGQEAFEIRTPVARYFYHKVGGGFSSLVDRDGKDWIGYRRRKRSAGEFRGIPNLVYRPTGDLNNHFHPGHSGQKASVTTLVEAESDLAVIESSAGGGRWRVRWEIHPQLARLTVLDIDPDDSGFWFLYEGTPGGRFSKADRCLRSDGTDLPLATRWEGRSSAIDWVAFRVPRRQRSLLLRLSGAPDVPVSYFPMKAMTVFGFGRKLNSSECLLMTRPVQFSVRLLETVDLQELEALAAAPD